MNDVVFAVGKADYGSFPECESGSGGQGTKPTR